MKETITVPAMLVGEDGRYVGNIGELELPHVPQIGSHILAHESFEANPSGPDPEHAYKVVDVRYQVTRRTEPSGVRRLTGWEIAVQHIGEHLDLRVTR